MNIFEYFTSAIRSILGTKGRSFLTMLGIIIGISAVILITALGTGFQTTIESQFEALGLDIAYVSMKSNSKDSPEDDDYLNLKDSENIAQLPGILAAVPTNSLGSEGVTLRGSDKTRALSFTGTTEEYPNTTKLDITHGRFLSSIDIENASNVIVIDETLALQLFGKVDIIGEKINVKMWYGQEVFDVVGVYQDSNMNIGMVEMFGMSATVYAPFSTIGQIIGTDDNVESITVKVADPDRIEEIADDVVLFLSKSHDNEKYDFYDYMNFSSFLDQAMQIITIFTLFFVIVAGISLFVGGIGVMNIMLVSVTERTQEIGIRKALGAKDRDIQLQFLFEAAILTLIGGMLGIAFGYGGAILAGYVINMLMAGNNFHLIINFSPLVASIASIFSLIVGVVFGVYPAIKASKLNPIDALRYE